MISWLMGVVICCAFLVGCGGGPKANVVPVEPVQPEVTASLPDDREEPLTEELSARRLEELYQKSGIPGWDAGLEEELKKWEHQVKFDVPIQMNKQVRAYLVYFSTERKEIIRRYLSRSTRYLPMIKEIFQEYGLPEDLAYLAMIESGFNNRAYSHAAACGMWQFIKGTGLRYGLAIDSYVDERRDPEKATRAAARYLLDLYKQFGSWYLAAASYNCGEGRVQRELNQSNHKNFWELSANMCLPSETKNYVPQMIAATIIAKNPEKFGFKNVPYQPPLKVEQVQVKEPTSLQAVAFAVNVPMEEIQALNPELSRGITPPDAASYTMNLPPNSKELFTRNITLASIEYPAVATRAVRAASVKSGGHSRGATKSRSSRKASVAGKSGNKTKAYARSTKKHTSQVAYAKNSKPTGNTATNGHAVPHVASVLGSSGAATNNDHDGKKKSSSQATAAAQGKKNTPGVTSKGKQQGSPVLAKKGDPATKNSKGKSTKKNNSSSNGSKDKVSQAKSKAILVSEAR